MVKYDPDKIFYPPNPGKVTLEQWMKDAEVSVEEMVQLVGCVKESIQRWMRGYCVPHRLHRNIIDKISKGKVKYERKFVRVPRGR